MPREVSIAPCSAPRARFTEHAGSDSEEDSPPPKRRYGKDHRSKVLVISDSDSDSDLPTTSSLLRPSTRTPAALVPGSKQPPASSDIIDISSDSEVEPTPTRPRPVGKPPSEKQLTVNATLPAVSPTCSVSTSLSKTLEFISLADTPSPVKPPGSKPLSTHADITATRDEEPNSSDLSELENPNIFDEDSYHPGLIRFDTSSRRPKIIALDSSTSVSTAPTPASSQSSCPNDDPFDDALLPCSVRPGTKTGNAKATSNGSGSRNRAKGTNNDSSTAPETPQLKPKPKARPALLPDLSAPVSLSPKPTPRNRAKVLAAQALALFSELNGSVFDDRLPKDCEIVWSKKLNTTAGRAHWKRIRDAEGNVIRHESYIELSTKVVDCEERVNNTLSHEMCHLAAWIFDGETDKPHGPKFKHWGGRVMKARPDITITTCHAYEISYKYEWKCMSEGCGRTFGRHSKSIDPTKQDYLKNHMKQFKASNPDMPHGEVMKRLGEMFRAEKESAVDADLHQVMAGMTRLKLGPNNASSD